MKNVNTNARCCVYHQTTKVDIAKFPNRLTIQLQYHQKRVFWEPIHEMKFSATLKITILKSDAMHAYY